MRYIIWMLRAETQIEYTLVVNTAEKILRENKYLYYRNQTKTVTEFEVYHPTKFRIMIEKEESYRFVILNLASSSVRTFVEVSRYVGDEDTEAKEHIGRFVDSLINQLPKKPWEGLGPIKSRNEKLRWLRFKEM